MVWTRYNNMYAAIEKGEDYFVAATYGDTQHLEHTLRVSIHRMRKLGRLSRNAKLSIQKDPAGVWVIPKCNQDSEQNPSDNT